MKTIEIQEIKDILDKSVKSSINIMFLGDTGIGKTQAIEDYAREGGYFLKTLILSQLEASEALGIPLESETEYNGVKYKSLSTAVPQWVFDLAKQEKAILFMDEFLTAPPAIMNSFLNFLSQKRVEDIDLSHVRIIAATNIEEYTFEPSSNILSRFCMFYTVNTKYNEYIKDKRIINNYKDDVPKVGILFNERSLKPRCQQQLQDIATEDLDMFYEGFTNTAMTPTFSSNEKIHSIVRSLSSYRPEKEGENDYYLSDNMLTSMSILLKKEFPKVSDWSPKIRSITNVSFNADKLEEILNRSEVIK